MSTPTAAASGEATGTAFAILAAISFCHMLNDMMQSLLPAVGLLAALLPRIGPRGRSIDHAAVTRSA